MNTRPSYAPADERFEHPGPPKAFSIVRHLVVGYLTISALNVAAIVVMRNDAAQMNSAVWTRAAAAARLGPAERLVNSTPTVDIAEQL